jgi:drug/metabolite transporter (DMT)-like permease
LLVVVIWGWSFVWIKDALDASSAILGAGHDAVSVGLFVGLRFGLAALLLPLFLPPARAIAARPLWRGSFVLAALMGGGFFLQTFALVDISPAVSAFLTSLYVAFTALLGRLLHHKRLGLALAIGVACATLGGGFISGPPQLHFDLPEWLSVGCALMFAGNILATDHFTRRLPPLPLTTLSFLWVTLFSIIILLFGMTSADAPAWSLLGQLILSPAYAWPLLLCTLLGTVFALSAMNQFQRVLDPVRAAVLYGLEPVFTAIIAVSLGIEDLSFWLVFGGVAVFSGNIIAELGPRVGQLAGYFQQQR